MINQAQDGLCLLSEQGKVLEVNAPFSEILGLAPQNVKGKDICTLFQGFDLNSLSFEKDTEQILKLDFLKDQVWHQVQLKVTKTQLSSDFSVPVYLISTYAQATLKQVQPFLDKIKELFHRLFQKVDVGIRVCDAQGKIVFVNRKACQLFGYSEKEQLGQALSSFVHPQDLDLIKVKNTENINWLNPPAHLAYQKLRYQTKQQGYLTVSASWYLIQGKQGQPFYQVEIFSPQSTLKIPSDLDKLALVASNTQESVVITDKDGYTEWVNQGFTNLTGYTLKEMLGKKPGHILQGPATKVESIQRITHKLQSKCPFSEDILNYKKTGEAYWIKMNITPILDKNGQIDRFIAIQSDITQQMEFTQKLREEKHKTEELNRTVLNSMDQISKNFEEIYQQKQLLDTKNQEISIRNEQITQSIRYAQRIQMAILPRTEQLHMHFEESFVFYQPRDIVSGDFYWFAEIGACKILILADCTGHGVPGAFMTILGDALLNDIVKGDQITLPDQILYHLDEQLKTKFRSELNADEGLDDGMDMAVVCIYPERQEIMFAGAKQSIYLAHENQLERYQGAKFPVGSFQYKVPKVFKSQTITYQPGDQIYLCSDGFQDQFGGPNNSKFLKRRFCNLLRHISHLPMKQQQPKLEKAFWAWKADYPQTDDVLVIGCQLH